MADIATKTPALVITNDKWGSPTVVFEGQGVQDILPGIEDYTPEMERQLVQDNTEVKKYWSTLGVLVTVDGDYYRYDRRGACKCVCDALSADIIDWSAEPEAQDEGINPTIWNAFFDIAGTRYDYPLNVHLGNGQTDSLRSIVEEALTVTDQRVADASDSFLLYPVEGGAR